MEYEAGEKVELKRDTGEDYDEIQTVIIADDVRESDEEVLIDFCTFKNLTSVSSMSKDEFKKRLVK